MPTENDNPRTQAVQFLNDLKMAALRLALLYDMHPELNDEIDIHSLIPNLNPMKLTEWAPELSAKIKKLIEPPLKDHEYEPPSQRELESMALSYIKNNDRKEYLRMKKAGELDEYCELSAKAAISYAESLKKTGSWAGEAWNMAIRSSILHSETD